MNPLESQFARFRAEHGNLLDRCVYRNELELLDKNPDSDGARRVREDLERFARLFSLDDKLCREVERILDCNDLYQPGPPSVLEVCGGGNWLSRCLSRRRRESNRPIKITATDFSASCIGQYRDRYPAEGINWEVADALTLPYRNKQFDLAVNVQALHHFTPVDVARVLSEMVRVANAVLIFDLRRTLYGALFIKLFTPFFSKEFISDGVASHRRAYSGRELDFVIRTSGLPLTVRDFLPVGLLIESIKS